MEYNNPQTILDYKNQIEEKIGYCFDGNSKLLVQAFTKNSFAAENDGFEDNEILEFYGDQLVNTIITKWMFESFSKLPGSYQNDFYYSSKNEAELSDIRSCHINKQALAHCIRLLELEEFLLVGKGDEKKEVWDNDKVLCDLFEAIIGAVAVHSSRKTSNGIDWNYAAIEKSCKKMWSMLKIDENYVDLLYDLCDEMNISEPRFKPLQTLFSINGQEYRSYVELYNEDGGLIQSFDSSSPDKDIAKQESAKAGLLFLKTCELKNELNTVTPENVLEVLNNLYLQKKISKPSFVFPSCINKDGEQIWTCEYNIDDFKDIKGYDEAGIAEGFTKQEAKQAAAYDLVCFITGKLNENRFWRCPYCGAENLLSNTICPRCN